MNKLFIVTNFIHQTGYEILVNQVYCLIATKEIYCTDESGGGYIVTKDMLS